MANPFELQTNRDHWIDLHSTLLHGFYIEIDIAKHKVVPLGLDAYLKGPGGKVISYGFALIAWAQTIYSISSDDFEQQALQRGYKLK